MQRREAGFSMIEILVSAVVTGVVAVSAFYFLSSQNTMGTKGSDLMKGVNLGKLGFLTEADEREIPALARRLAAGRLEEVLAPMLACSLRRGGRRDGPPTIHEDLCLQ